MIDIRHGDYRNEISECADLIITSPPYNIGSKRKAKTGRRKHGEYDPKSYRGITEYSDSLPEDKYQDWQLSFLYWSYEHLKPNGTLVYNHKPRRRKGRMIHPMEWIGKCDALVLMEEIIWDRGSTHNHGRQLFWPITERLYIFKRVREKYRLDNYRDKGLSHQSDLWSIPRSPSNGHNAPFHLELAEQAIKAYTEVGDLVMDPFLGSGTSAVAALKSNRDFIGSEKLKKYFSQSKRRIKNEEEVEEEKVEEVECS